MPNPGRVQLIRYALSGAAAGVLSSLSFAVIHQWLITSLWFFIYPMLAAGALCGLCLGWSYGLLRPKPSLRSWLAYNGLIVSMLALLGLTSLLVFKPVTTIAALLRLPGPPEDLFQQALPMTITFTLATTLVLSLIYRRGWRGLLAIFITSATVVAFLGLNVSVIGLVEIPRSFLYLVAELIGFILALAGVFAIAFAALNYDSLRLLRAAPPRVPRSAGH